MHVCSYAHDLNALPDAVRAALEEQAYETFLGRGGPPGAGAGSSGAHHDPDVPPPLAETARRLIATAAFSSYTRGNHPLSERLAHEAVRWCNEQWSLLEETDPLNDEESALEELEGSVSLEEARGLLPVAQRPVLARNTAPLLAASPPGRGKITRKSRTAERVETRARIAEVADRWRSAITTERERFQKRELGRALGAFIREMGAVVPRLARAQPVIRDLFGTEQALWDQSRGRWVETDWDALAATAEALREMPELRRLAEILGRSRVVTERRLVRRVIREVSRRPVGLGKSEVTGVNFGDDLTSLLPSEVALLADPQTEDLFYAKLAHKELLQLDYRRERVVEHARQRAVSVHEDVTVPRGPVIACVDTSGSMLGTPERVAKATTLALAARLAADGRAFHVIAFSTDVHAITIDPAAADIASLTQFLGGSFHGGTDLRPALEESLRVLEDGQFTHADVLVVSDFRIPKIADRFIDRIKGQQKLGTLFHSLTVARAPVRDPLHIFDNSWLFDISEGTRGIRPDTLRFLG